MKYISITVLLALSLFMVYSTPVSNDPTLTLKASVSGDLFHGFSTVDSTNSNTARQVITSSQVGDQLKTGIDMESSQAQDVGFYNILTTSANQVKVTLKVSPMKAVLGTTSYYVPYLLSYEESHGTGNVDVDGNGQIGSDTLSPSTTNPGDVSKQILHTGSHGLRWKTFALSVTFNGDENESFGLPEANFSGTVVAQITTF
ncbi:MAG: hypothetical protein JXK93_13825 [Sphaerochaetaceae bacterium]|nr:hypothetical protein [Sphaerochaetaceae bacterium]